MFKITVYYKTQYMHGLWKLKGVHFLDWYESER
jgi:hypothetical protein